MFPLPGAGSAGTGSPRYPDLEQDPDCAATAAPEAKRQKLTAKAKARSAFNPAWMQEIVVTKLPTGK